MPGWLEVAAGQRRVSRGRLCDRCCARTALRMSAAPHRVVELGHEFAVGGAGGGEVVVAFLELEPQVNDLLLQVGDLLVEGAGVGGGAEPGFAPGLLAECFGQAMLELLDAGGEPDGAFAGAGQVGLQGGPGDRGPGGFGGGGRGGFEGVDLAEQVPVPVEEAAVDDLLTELLNVSAAQDRCASRQPVAGMSGRSESPGRRSLVVSRIATETGHTGLNQSAAFSSLPLFDVSCSGS